MKRKAFTNVEFIVVATIIMLVLAFFEPLGIFFHIVFGWIWGVGHLIAGLRHEPVALLIGGVALVLLPIALHRFVRGILKNDTKWRFRQSVAVTGIACSLIATTISMIALIHEIYWLRNTDKPLTTNIALQMSNMNHLKQIVYGAHRYADANDTALPSGGTILPDGRSGHGWMTQLLPYMDDDESTKLYESIDFSQPWNAPINDAVFKNKTPKMYGKYTRRDTKTVKNEAGYALTDFAANERVMPLGRSLRFHDITDGTSNTLFCGEVKENFQPWGSSQNGRDPALGLNSTPHGFGGANGYATNSVLFVMCDGSVRRISDTIAPEILRALATPNSGEKVEVNDLD